MLGGYYLGQLYLGDSGYSQQTTVIINDCTHSIDSSIPQLVQNLYLEVYFASHELTSDTVSLLQYMILHKPDDSIIHLTSDNLVIVENKTLESYSSRHSLTSSDNVKIINWTELGVDFGWYIKDFTESGTINQETFDSGLLNKKYTNKGSFEQVTVDEDGSYDIKYNNKGIY